MDPVMHAQATRVVLAEDDEALRTQLAEALRARGCEVAEMADGHALLEFVSSRLGKDGFVEGVDVVVSDIRMPGFSGMDVLVGMRRFRRKTPVILITAFASETTRQLARAFGAVAVLDKPFAAKLLTNAVFASLVSR